jgi:hypothetical protein
MGTNPENEAQPKVNECIALNGPSGRPFIESAHNLHELASHLDYAHRLVDATWPSMHCGAVFRWLHLAEQKHEWPD